MKLCMFVAIFYDVITPPPQKKILKQEPQFEWSVWLNKWVSFIQSVVGTEAMPSKCRHILFCTHLSIFTITVLESK